VNDALDPVLFDFCRLFPEGSFFNGPSNVMGLVAVLLVCLICGAVGSLVVGNRMAFFSDALAHAAFAGMALGLLLGLATSAGESTVTAWLTPIMAGFGIVVGVLIAYVRETSGQASDTVIGVFFAFAIGLGALLLKAASSRRYLPPEDFLFGNILTVRWGDLVTLVVLGVLTAAVLAWRYNQMVFTSFSPSLALSRQIPVRFCNYLFIILLALIVNICLKAVGALLINALLVVPAAAAANLCRNMRQLFWASVGLCLLAGFGGQFLSWELMTSEALYRSRIRVSEAGMVVVLTVLLYVVSMLLGPVRRRRGWLAAARAGLHNR
jgi:zinc transport system permease protein